MLLILITILQELMVEAYELKTIILFILIMQIYLIIQPIQMALVFILIPPPIYKAHLTSIIIQLMNQAELFIIILLLL